MRRAARRINSARRNSWSTPRVSRGKEREHVLYLLTLPFRILFGILLAVLLLPLGLLFLPFLLLRAVLKLAVVAVIAPCRPFSPAGGGCCGPPPPCLARR